MERTFTITLSDGDHAVTIKTQRRNPNAETTLDVTLDGNKFAVKHDTTERSREIYSNPTFLTEFAEAKRHVEMFG